MYQVVIEKQVQKHLAKITPPNYNKVVSALQDLANNPRPQGYKKLKGRQGFRVRIGEYRIIYNINDNILTVFILAIGNRRDVYK
jgi:mRNA interferase RelE/StbE